MLFSLPHYCLPWLPAVAHYLRQNLLIFLHIPKYTDSNTAHHFKVTSARRSGTGSRRWFTLHGCVGLRCGCEWSNDLSVSAAGGVRALPPPLGSTRFRSDGFRMPTLAGAEPHFPVLLCTLRKSPSSLQSSASLRQLVQKRPSSFIHRIVHV